MIALPVVASGTDAEPSSPDPGTTTIDPPSTCASVDECAAIIEQQQGQIVELTKRERRARLRAYHLRIERRRLLRRWRPTVDYAIRLGAAVSGVSVWQMRRVAYCESTNDPTATNGRYRGLFQLGWSPFGMSPFDPVANAISAGMTVAHDGSWRQWECKP
jgi:hypothetical protein